MEYYIYLHKTLDTNVPFYIGKGKGKRAYVTRGRSLHWKNTVSKHGYSIEFLETGLTPEEAVEREMFWIAKHGRKDLKRGTLVNFTDGGEGTHGRIIAEHVKKAVAEANKKRVASEVNRTKTGSLYKGKTGALHNRSKGIKCSNGKTYGSMSEAARELGIHVSSVSWSVKNQKPINQMHFEIGS